MTALRFEHETLPGRVLFGAGRAAETATEAARLGTPALVIAARSEAALAERVAALLGDGCAGTIVGVRPHVPLDGAEDARRQARAAGAASLVALGGGSAIGLAKAVALTERLPITAVPTTYSGSEMTPIWGVSEGGRKTTGRDLVVLPRTVVYDPELTLSLPPAVTAASGMNAVAHCVEALWVERATPLTDAVATAGLRRLAVGLHAAVTRPTDLEARTHALAGAWLAGCTLAATGTGLHHKLCHVLGGLDLPHAETHAVLLPHVAEHQRVRAPDALAQVGAALGSGDGVEALRALARTLGTPASLRDLGLTLEQTRRAADLGAAAGVADRDELLRILERALAGG